MAHDVFVSYSTQDKQIADAVCASLEAAGIRCWIAPRDIPPGQSWPKAIPAAIDESKLMVLIFSSHVNSSSYVIKEVTLASNSRIPVMPFRIQDSIPVGELQFLLCNTQWLDAMTPPLELHIRNLVERTQRDLSNRAAYTPPQPQVSATPVQPSVANVAPTPAPTYTQAPTQTMPPQHFVPPAQPGPPMQAPTPMPGAPASWPATGKPQSYLVYSIITTVLCCIPGGIAAILYSNKSDNLWRAGDRQGAEKASIAARNWIIASVILSIIATFILIAASANS